MKNVVYIHGANCSSKSFRYIQSRLAHKSILNLEYSVHTPFVDNERIFNNIVRNEFNGEEFSIIGHSMGGLFAARMLNTHDNATGAITMSAPYGGSKFVGYLQLIIPKYQLFTDIKITSQLIKDFKTYTTKKPLTQIVTMNGGNPLMGEANDGTVTVMSQRTLKNINYVEAHELNHFEILMSDLAVDNIENFMLTH